jgi:hypothetical protein
VSSVQSSGKDPTQPGDSLAARRIKVAADRSNNCLQRPLGNVRWSERETGVKNSEPRGMQSHCLSEKSIGFALMRRPLAPELANVAEQRRDIRADRHGTASAQPRSLKGRVAVARIGDEGLPLGIQQRDETGLGDTEQRAQDATVGKLADCRHSREAVCTTPGSAPDQVGFDLIFALMRG